MEVRPGILAVSYNQRLEIVFDGVLADIEGVAVLFPDVRMKLVCDAGMGLSGVVCVSFGCLGSSPVVQATSITRSGGFRRRPVAARQDTPAMVRE